MRGLNGRGGKNSTGKDGGVRGWLGCGHPSVIGNGGGRCAGFVTNSLARASGLVRRNESCRDGGVDAEHVIEIRLCPEQLSRDACEVFALALARSVLAVFPDGLPEAPGQVWKQRASELIRVGRPPLPASFPLAVQVEQLTALLVPAGFQVVIVSSALPLHLQRAVEWLEAHSMIRIARVVPEAGAHSVGHGVITEVTVMGVEAEKGCTVSIFQLGQPHPQSPGEHKLFKRLEADAELAGCFASNVQIHSRHGRLFCVDFFQAETGLVVEVDGYSFHSGRKAFFSDRHRDYELLVSGFVTLRLDHDEIIRDLESAVGKIRDVYRFLQRKTA